LATAAADLLVLTAFRSIGLLDVLLRLGTGGRAVAGFSL
jgi:hypothetical protein